MHAFFSRRAWLAWAMSTPACAQPQGTPPGDELAAMTAQWRALRTQRGHFDGAAFNPDVDRWQGRKHLLMQQLAAQALAQRMPREALLQWLGAPDDTWREGQAEHAQALQQARWQGVPRGPMLVYDWRGRRDRLVFALQDDRVAAAGWLYTFE